MLPRLPFLSPSPVLLRPLLSFLSRHWTENVLVCGPRKPRKRGRSPAIRRGKGRWRTKEGRRETSNANAARGKEKMEESKEKKWSQNATESSLVIAVNKGTTSFFPVRPTAAASKMRNRSIIRYIGLQLQRRGRKKEGRKEHAPLSKIGRKEEDGEKDDFSRCRISSVCSLGA